MFEDRLQSNLINNGYQRVDSNAQGIYLFHCALKDELRIVSVIRVIVGNELSFGQYEHILEQIKANFRNTFPLNIKLVSLILTANPDQVKQFATDIREDNHWIIDIRTNRLIIYETQSNDLTDLQRIIEQLLTEDQLEQDQAQYNQGAYQGPNRQSTYNHGGNNQGGYTEGRYQQTTPSRSANYRYVLTPVTMSIIALNLAAYILTHFTRFFGGPEAMLANGALSWYYVVEMKEYYRIITSIFMHADWSHIVNNMIVLLFLGGNLERIIGKGKYLIIYFATGILAGISSIGYNMWKEYAPVVAVSETTISIGASGAIFGIVGAVLLIVLINRGRLKEISSRQMIWFVFLSLYSGFVNSQIDMAAHVGGFIAGIILAGILYRKPSILIKNA